MQEALFAEQGKAKESQVQLSICKTASQILLLI
jgi:hypothetical protein